MHQQQRNVCPVRPDASGAPGAGAHYFAKSRFMTQPMCPGGTILPTSYQAQPPFPQPPRCNPPSHSLSGATPLPTASKAQLPFPLYSRHTMSVSCLSQRLFIQPCFHNSRHHELASTIPDIGNQLIQHHRSQFPSPSDHRECRYISPLVFTTVLNFYAIIIFIKISKYIYTKTS